MMQAVAQNLPTERLRIYIHLDATRDVEAYRVRYLEGREPDESPYGFHLAEKEGFDVSFARDRPGLIDRIFYRLIRRPKGFDLFHIYANRVAIRASHAIWTMTEREAFALSALMYVKLIPRRPIISNAVWLLNRWSNLSLFRRLFYKRISRYISVMTVHSQSCLPILRSAFPRLRSELMYFGINTDLFRLTPPVSTRRDGPIRIFAIGNDRTRDWDTLLSAFGNDVRFEVTLICWWFEEDKLRAFNNLRLLRHPTMSEMLSCYQDADFVAVPMVENVYSGITVALEATALGKPVVASRTGGLPTYFEEDEVFFAPVGDFNALRDIVLGADAAARRGRAEAAQAKFLARDYSTRAVIRRYAKITREII